MTGRLRSLVPGLALAALTVGAAAVPLRPLHAQAGAESDHRARTEATRAVATQFLRRMFVDRDVRRAYDDFAAPDLIQHNPMMADGLAGHRAYFAQLEQRAGSSAGWANVNNMILVDGDLFALHHHAFTGPDDRGRVFVDIWRVANGRIVEHWDVIQPIPAEMAHDNGMGCGKGEDHAAALALRDTIAAPACGLPDSAASRSRSLEVVDAYDRMLRGGQVREAVDRMLTDDYRQHSPLIADGKAGALAFLERLLDKDAAAKLVMGPVRIIAEGDFVLMHRLTRYADEMRTANVEIFRVRDGRISAHWDVKQPIPETAANGNGMW